MVVTDIMPLVAEETVLRIVAAGGVLLGAFLIVWGVHGFRRALAVWANDPVPVGEAYLVDGTLEVEGTAEALSETLRSPYDDEPCLAYSYSKKRKERERNDDGEWETTWRTVDSGSDSVPFLVADDTGSIPVDPAAATLSMDNEYSDRRGDIKRTENRIDPGDGVHVIGQKRGVVESDLDLGEARSYIGDGEDAPTFRITDGSELETVARMFGRSALAVAIGAGAVAWGGRLLARQFPGAVPV